MVYALGLLELCSEFLSLFYSEFLLKSVYYAQFYSFCDYDFIIILYLATVELLNTFSYTHQVISHNNFLMVH